MKTIKIIKFNRSKISIISTTKQQSNACSAPSVESLLLKKLMKPENIIEPLIPNKVHSPNMVPIIVVREEKMIFTIEKKKGEGSIIHSGVLRRSDKGRLGVFFFNYLRNHV
ncbi:hypothetical protein FCM35_KLT10570 [Carex littledalei]|uniref:Uncharacterized protein n=1 Tax=Carex littledalei TaxID=544730 RepID=A0A833VIZ3_9POAL|nr:hypothetical protein FCM35_KLT10570 [Carex littledalei]